MLKECNEDIGSVLCEESVEAKKRAEQWERVKHELHGSAALNLVVGDFNAPFFTFNETEWENGVASSGRTEFDDNLDLYDEAVDLICFERVKLRSFHFQEIGLFQVSGGDWKACLQECMTKFGSDHVPVLMESNARVLIVCVLKLMHFKTSFSHRIRHQAPILELRFQKLAH